MIAYFFPPPPLASAFENGLSYSPKRERCHQDNQGKSVLKKRLCTWHQSPVV